MYCLQKTENKSQSRVVTPIFTYSIKCSGASPCPACSGRGTPCEYDAASDQRRKIANTKTVHDLAQARTELDRHQQLLGGILATFRAGQMDDHSALLSVVHSGMDLSQLAAHVRNTRRSSPAVEHAFGVARLQLCQEDWTGTSNGCATERTNDWANPMSNRLGTGPTPDGMLMEEHEYDEEDGYQHEDGYAHQDGHAREDGYAHQDGHAREDGYAREDGHAQANEYQYPAPTYGMR